MSYENRLKNFGLGASAAPEVVGLIADMGKDADKEIADLKAKLGASEHTCKINYDQFMQKRRENYSLKARLADSVAPIGK